MSPKLKKLNDSGPKMSELFSQSEVLSVSQVTRTIKSLIERHLPEILVRGEISNFVRAASGHCYFSLKDDSSQVRCVLFRSRMVAAAFEIANGIEVELLATPSMFEKRGGVSIDCSIDS